MTWDTRDLLEEFTGGTGYYVNHQSFIHHRILFDDKIDGEQQHVDHNTLFFLFFFILVYLKVLCSPRDYEDILRGN